MKVEKLIIHCSDSPQGRGDDAETIHQWHKAKGWDGIGYHAVILEDGTVQNGRPDFWPGSHAYGYNTKSLGICLIGNGSYTTKQFEALAYWLIAKAAKHDVAAHDIIGHCDVSSKACPKFDVEAFKWKYNITRGE